jgi:hypothetical protein
MSFVLTLVSGMSLITADLAAGAVAVLQRRMANNGDVRPALLLDLAID